MVQQCASSACLFIQSRTSPVSFSFTRKRWCPTLRWLQHQDHPWIAAPIVANTNHCTINILTATQLITDIHHVFPPEYFAFWMVSMVYMKYWNRVHLIYIQVKGYIDLARQEGCSILCGNSTEEPQLPEKNRNVGDISNYSLSCLGDS